LTFLLFKLLFKLPISLANIKTTFTFYAINTQQSIILNCAFDVREVD